MARVSNAPQRVLKKRTETNPIPPGGCFQKGVGVLLNPTHSLFSASDDFWNRWILTKQRKNIDFHPLQNLD